MATGAVLGGLSGTWHISRVCSRLLCKAITFVSRSGPDVPMMSAMLAAGFFFFFGFPRRYCLQRGDAASETALAIPPHAVTGKAHICLRGFCIPLPWPSRAWWLVPAERGACTLRLASPVPLFLAFRLCPSLWLVISWLTGDTRAPAFRLAGQSCPPPVFPRSYPILLHFASFLHLAMP